jgi:hypothetical protein
MDPWLADDDLEVSESPRRSAGAPSLNGLPRDIQRNRLLGQLVTLRRDLTAHLERRTFFTGHVWPADVHDSHRVVFPLSAVATVVQEAVDGHPAPLAMIGNEGVWDPKAFLQPPRLGRRKWVVHAGGDACVLDRSHVVAAGETNDEVHRVLCRWDRVLLDRVAQSALCNRHHDVQQQVASWLLVNQRRYRVAEVGITQTVLADLLGVRRESVSRSVGKLVAARALAASEHGLAIANVAKLKVFACECYQATE